MNTASVVLAVAIAGVMAVVVEPTRAAIALAALAPVGVVLSVIDARTRLLPRRIVVPTTIAALMLVGVDWLVYRQTDVLVTALLGMLAMRTLFWILWFVKRAGMGFGDVRLAALVGLVLGYFGWSVWFAGVYAGLLTFAIYAVALAVVRRDRSVLRRPLPYGPFMLAGLVMGIMLSPVLTG